MAGEEPRVLDFLRTLWPVELPGASLHLWRKGSPTEWFPVSETGLAELASRAASLSGHVYVSICAHDRERSIQGAKAEAEEKGKDPAKAAVYARGDATACVAIPGLWLDLDVAEWKPDAAKKRYPTEQAARHLLASLPLPPSAMVYSGGGFYPIWLFNEPADPAEHGDLPARWTTYLRGRLNGYDLDSTGDLARVLRMPGTYNSRYTPPRSCEVRELHADRRYNPEDFAELIEAAETLRAKQTNAKPPPSSSSDSCGAPLTDQQILDLAAHAKNAEKFQRLMAGNIDEYASDSEADLALLCMLVFYTRNPDQLDRLFRQSKLCREKWERPDYRDRTIGRALALVRDVYSPRNGSAKKPKRKDKPAPHEGAILWLPPELPNVVDQAEAALLRTGEQIYQRGGQLVRPVRADSPTAHAGIRRPAGALTLVPVEAAHLVERMTAAVPWVKWDGRAQDWRPWCCPAQVAATYLARRGYWCVPVLTAVTRHPIMMADGRIIAAAGHDQESGILVDVEDEWPILEAPTRADAEAACARLRHLLRHFPFAGEADRSVALSLLLTVIARPVLPAAPLHAIDAPEAGTGKSLLVDLAAILSTDAQAPVLDYGRDPDEAAKRLDTMLLAGDPLICVDNIEVPLEGTALCQTLTQPQRTVRLLGTHTQLKVPCTATITATGNNLTLRGDVVRRSVVCRLDAGTERPELRKIDQDLLAEATDRRRELVADVLTVMAAYVQAGSPDVGLPPLGSFGPWSRMVRAGLVWVGEADPVGTMERTRGADPHRQALHAVLSAWHEAVGSDPMTAADIIRRAEHHENLRTALAVVSERGSRLDARALGYWLRRYRGSRAAGYVLSSRTGHAGSLRWSVTLDGQMT